MNKSRSWVGRLLALVSVGMLVLTPAAAQIPVSTSISAIGDWEYPGRFKFKGTPQQACDIFVDYGLLKTACLTAIDLKERGGCEEFFLKDGDIITTTFTGGSGHGASTLRVNFKDDKGQPVPANHEMRRAHRCATGILGIVIVFPEVCGNWSIMTVVPPTQPVKLEEPPPEEKKARWVCATEYYHSSGGHNHLHLPGVFIPGCPDLFVGGVTITSGILQSQGGSSDTCRWVAE